MIQLEELKSKLLELKPQIDDYRSAIGMDDLLKKQQQLEGETADPNFWDDLENSSKVLQQISLVLLKAVPAAQHQQFALPVGGESAAQIFQRVTQQILIQRNFPRGGQQLVQAEKGLDLAVLPEGLHYSEQVAIALYLILLCA